MSYETITYEAKGPIGVLTMNRPERRNAMNYKMRDEMRSAADGEWQRGIELDDALDEIEDRVDEIQYRGHWYLVFEGGCITYSFDTEGKMAVSIAREADAAIGLYRNSDLIDAARNSGFEPVGRQMP